LDVRRSIMSRYLDVHAKRCRWIRNKDARRKQTFSHCNTLHHTATHCITLQHKQTFSHGNTLHHTATHCITLQHKQTFSHGNALHHTASHCIALQHKQTFSHCNTLHHTATHCSTLQHTATHSNRPLHSVFCMCCNSSAGSVLQCVTACCSVLQKRCMLQIDIPAPYTDAPQQLSRQCVAACCSVSSQYVANRHSYTMCCIAATSRPTVCCSVSQCNAVSRSTSRKATHSHYILRVPHDRSLTRTCSKP